MHTYKAMYEWLKKDTTHLWELEKAHPQMV